MWRDWNKTFTAVLLLLTWTRFTVVRGETDEEVCKKWGLQWPSNPHQQIMEVRNIDIRAITKSGSEETYTQIPFCSILTQAPCRKSSLPFNYNNGIPGNPIEYSTPADRPDYLEKYLETFLPDIAPLKQFDYNQLPNLPTDLQWDYNKAAEKYKGFGCKSGECASTDIFHFCTNGMQYEINFAFIQTTITNVYNWIEQQKSLPSPNEIPPTSCDYVIKPEIANRSYRRFNETDTTPGIGKIQVKPDSQVYQISLCLIKFDKPCFPQTRKEFKSLQEYLKDTKALSSNNSTMDKDKDTGGSDGDKKRTQFLILKSWNCESGTCNPKSKKCASGDRISKVWKLYEYKNGGSPLNSEKSFPIVLFTTHLILIRTYIS